MVPRLDRCACALATSESGRTWSTIRRTFLSMISLRSSAMADWLSRPGTFADRANPMAARFSRKLDNGTEAGVLLALP